MIDMHSHIIYGVDDGAKTEEMTINMLKMSMASGVKKIVATPHYMKGRFNVPYDQIKDKVKELNKLASSKGIDIDIYAAQEVYYSNKIQEYYENGEIGTINNGRYMLIELPMTEFDPREVTDDLHELTLLGVKPIIAHPERYIPFIKKPSLINELIKEGYLFQLNSGSLLGDFGKEVKKLAKQYLENGVYSVVGSDGHRDNIRTTNLSEFLKNISEKDKENFYKNGEKIINNDEVRFSGSMVKEKKNFGIFFSILGK